MNKYQTPLTKFIEDGHRLTHRERHQFGAILQELVDKETPMKVKIKVKLKGENYYTAMCPQCRYLTNLAINEFDEKQCYCFKCGQNLLW